MKPVKNRYTISQLAKAAGVSLKTIRHYLECGLISYEDMTVSGYRIFSDVAVEVIRKIKRLQRAGYTLEQIGKILNHQTDTDDISARRRQLEEEVSEKELALNQLILAEVNSKLRSEPLSLATELELSDIVLKKSSPNFLKEIASIVTKLSTEDLKKVQDLNAAFYARLNHFIKTKTLPTDKAVGCLINEIFNANCEILGQEIAIKLYEINRQFLSNDPNATLATQGDLKLVEFMAAALEHWKP